jgi:hypothetical protein
MNSRAEPAFEAVSYIRQFVGKYRERFVHMLKEELESLMDDIARALGVDFHARLRNPS